jgi:hypothetical protein
LLCSWLSELLIWKTKKLLYWGHLWQRDYFGSDGQIIMGGMHYC